MLDTVFIGLSIGSILLLVALGLSIVYGSMGVINMAHGELVMMGAYTTVLAQTYLGFNLFAAIPLAFLVCAGLGLLIEKLVIRRLYNRLFDTLLATWGVAILLQQAIRLEFGLSFFGIHIDGLGPGLQSVTLPEIMTESFTVGEFVIQPYRTFIILVSALLALLTWFVMYRTRIGQQVRAIMRNPDMAAACGIDVKKVNALTFAYGAGLAGVAGVMMSGFKTVMPDMGSSLVVDGFLVVVVGGVGSLVGSIVASGILGQLNGVVAFFSNDIIARAVVFAAVIAIIIWRPRGLFNYKGR
ncbi:MAG: urea ABC transporter permease subunit UrtB [Methylophaga sp.]|uniref:urea ABC transporter permease subunit UrtB n=1 Tax=Methylophaga sp. UBA678 TaxID=1946901 RepID=UPI000C4711EC|nr:urea ABC transporter permease subunit UrtB [Methylophaga sp. UBA678]MAX52702.1 urea ABC transporter permease subunit UrtB [Methylophaga sp.]|tara:strand:- start:62138 stop:63031 length:894 start_codon:yes stop_codon:yes gene_type:complete